MLGCVISFVSKFYLHSILIELSNCELTARIQRTEHCSNLYKLSLTSTLRNLKKEIKVAQLVGSVSEISGYHHGEASLAGTIINLAQNFVGSNNLNLLEPNGNSLKLKFCALTFLIRENTPEQFIS